MPKTMLSCLLAAVCLAAADEKPRVYTNDDLDRVSPYRGQTGVESKPTSAPAEKGSARSSGKGSSRGEPYWREQADRTAERVRQLREQATEMADRIEDLRRQPEVRPYSDPRIVAMEKKRQALEARAREAELRLEERARRAGALPGWLR